MYVSRMHACGETSDRRTVRRYCESTARAAVAARGREREEMVLFCQFVHARGRGRRVGGFMRRRFWGPDYSRATGALLSAVLTVCFASLRAAVLRTRGGTRIVRSATSGWGVYGDI